MIFPSGTINSANTHLYSTYKQAKKLLKPQDNHEETSEEKLIRSPENVYGKQQCNDSDR